MLDQEYAVRTVIKEQDFNPQLVGQARRIMHEALFRAGVKTVRHYAPVLRPNDRDDRYLEGEPYWELNAWGVA